MTQSRHTPETEHDRGARMATIGLQKDIERLESINAELLESLDDLLKGLKILKENMDENGDVLKIVADEFELCVLNARAAIAKARGE